jgi:hypothetical protein
MRGGEGRVDDSESVASWVADERVRPPLLIDATAPGYCSQRQGLGGVKEVGQRTALTSILCTHAKGRERARTSWAHALFTTAAEDKATRTLSVAVALSIGARGYVIPDRYTLN